jgi:hypothetical protein
LAGHTAFDIGHNEVMHVRPLVVLGDKVDGFGNFRVASSGRIVKKVCYPPPKTIVFHNNKGVIFVYIVFFIEVELVGGYPCI